MFLFVTKPYCKDYLKTACEMGKFDMVDAILPYKKTLPSSQSLLLAE